MKKLSCVFYAIYVFRKLLKSKSKTNLVYTIIVFFFCLLIFIVIFSYLHVFHLGDP